MKICIAGNGYVGLSNAILLAQYNEVVAIDIFPAKVDMVNQRKSPIEDAELEHYGGYCLPKDTKQLLANFDAVSQNIMRAIVDRNTTRKDFCAVKIIKRTPRVVGIYRLVMKAGSNNWRSRTQRIAKRMKGEKLGGYYS